MVNSKFTDEQIKAYAAQFREGDAIWSGGEWHEVVENEVNGDSRLTAHVDRNIFVINDAQLGNHYGFKVMGLNKNPYRVTTLDDYELQGGEKIVWLGESDDFRTFGKSYEVDENKRYICDDGISLKVMSVLWGIIPRYEQVKNDMKILGGQLNETCASKGIKLSKALSNSVINRPASSHYHIDNNGNDVWKFADDNLSDERVKGFHQINAIKYVARYEKKHDTAEKRIEDLEKAKVSIDKLIELERKSDE